jgi:hypothetical protein
MVMLIQILAAVLLVLGSGLVVRAFVELDRELAGPEAAGRITRPENPPRDLPRAA